MAGTAVLVAVTLPGTAGADDSGVRADRSARQRAGAAGAGGRAVSPGVVEAAPTRNGRARAATR
ncbi:hypothetical protein ACPCBX_05405 [Streptomyces tuirus]|uniref:Uncharacterized protein n=1 Tax=Streptomyces tuirus TaxID=68278 RepID=A0A7G1NME3_9ACTN|nr:hypothetical protein GCM10017668_55840 [Streptomyces tuirus]